MRRWVSLPRDPIGSSWRSTEGSNRIIEPDSSL
jgi:hypothetical protein